MKENKIFANNDETELKTKSDERNEYASPSMKKLREVSSETNLGE